MVLLLLGSPAGKTPIVNRARSERRALIRSGDRLWTSSLLVAARCAMQNMKKSGTIVVKQLYRNYDYVLSYARYGGGSPDFGVPFRFFGASASSIAGS